MARIQVVLDDEIERKFREVLSKRNIFRKGAISEEIEKLISKDISIEKIDNVEIIKQSKEMEIDSETMTQIHNFYLNIPTIEKSINKPLMILEDEKINSFYAECHILAKDYIKLMDLDPSIDPEEQDDFRSNRNFEPDNPDYKKMVLDAKDGRQFSDIVIEYNSSKKNKNPNKPLKVFGGQHRSHAIKEAFEYNSKNRIHGLKIYFNLNIETRGDIAIVSNTNIHVANDLRDRMDEQTLSPPNKLRNFCYEIGILSKKENEDFSSKRSSDLITVRLLRTFIVNFYMGKNEADNFDNKLIVPVLTDTGGADEEYSKLYKKHDFIEDKELLYAGKNFFKLYKKQYEKASGKSKLLVLSLAIAPSWSCSAGILQKDKERLKKLYNLPDINTKDDPLKSNLLASARGDDDPPQYRGLITRYGEKERGRLLQLFLIFSKSSKNTITRDMIRLAIADYKDKKDSKNREALRKKVL